MGFDIKDIADLVPFILANLSKCVYIAVVSLIVGFSLGKFTSKCDTKSKRKLKKEVQVLADENKKLKDKLQNSQNIRFQQNSPFTSLSDFEHLITSEKASVEINALYEIKVKSITEDHKT